MKIILYLQQGNYLYNRKIGVNLINEHQGWGLGEGIEAGL